MVTHHKNSFYCIYRLLGTGAVAFIKYEEICNFHESSFHSLYGITGFRN